MAFIPVANSRMCGAKRTSPPKKCVKFALTIQRGGISVLEVRPMTNTFSFSSRITTWWRPRTFSNSWIVIELLPFIAAYVAP